MNRIQATPQTRRALRFFSNRMINRGGKIPIV
jgi:hypothetical protein